MEFKRAVILGSGSSSSTPFLTCTLAKKDCAACRDALAHPAGRNHRLNPSFLIELRHPSDGSTHHVLIDCGKTFRETVLKLFPKLGVADLSGVLLTHDHADACFGIDDLRELNRKDKGCPDGALDVYADERTLASMKRIFYYLFPKSDAASPVAAPTTTNGTGDFKNRPWMATLGWHAFAADHVLEVPIACRDASCARATWRVVPLPVTHGKGYHCNAFLMPLSTTPSSSSSSSSGAAELLLYVSDVSSLELGDCAKSVDSLTFLKRVHNARRALGDASVDPNTDAVVDDDGAHVCDHNRRHPLAVLIIDLMSDREYFSHFNTDEAIAAATFIGARRTYFVGLSHSIEYAALTDRLAQRGVGDVMFVGFDGCVVAEAAPSQHPVSASEPDVKPTSTVSE